MILRWEKWLTGQKDLLPSRETLSWLAGEGLIGTQWNTSKEKKGRSAWGELPLAPGQDRDLRLTGEQFGRKVPGGSWSSCLPWGRNVPWQQNRPTAPLGCIRKRAASKSREEIFPLYPALVTVSGVMAPVERSLAHERDGNTGASTVRDQKDD